MPWCGRRSAPTSSAPPSARPTSSSSMPRPADRRLRYRGHARPQRRARRAQADSCRMPISRSMASATASCCPASASSPIEAQQAGDLAARLAGGADKVVNSIAVRGRDQVMLKVTVAEVAAQHHQAARHRPHRQPELRHRGRELQQRQSVHRSRPAAGRQQSRSGLVRGSRHPVGHGDAAAPWKAPAWSGRWRSRTSPRSPANRRRSSRAANFRSRRAIPAIPTTRVCTTQISFKKFGISLNFTPVVLTEGRISLRVMTEVSELSNENSMTVTQCGSTQLPHGALDQDPARRNDAGNSVRRLDGDGRPDPGTDQAGDQRPAGSDAIAGPRIAVPQPRLRQQPDRADGPGDALCRARRRAEGSVAAR